MDNFTKYETGLKDDLIRLQIPLRTIEVLMVVFKSIYKQGVIDGMEESIKKFREPITEDRS